MPDWNASMLEIGDDMGVDDDATRWVVEKVGEAYMTDDDQSWVQPPPGKTWARAA